MIDHQVSNPTENTPRRWCPWCSQPALVGTATPSSILQLEYEKKLMILQEKKATILLQLVDITNNSHRIIHQSSPDVRDSCRSLHRQLESLQDLLRYDSDASVSTTSSIGYEESSTPGKLQRPNYLAAWGSTSGSPLPTPRMLSPISHHSVSNEGDDNITNADQWEEHEINASEYRIGEDVFVLRNEGCWSPCTVSNITKKNTFILTGEDSVGSFTKLISSKDCSRFMKPSTGCESQPSGENVSSVVSEPTCRSVEVSSSVKRKGTRIRGVATAKMVSRKRKGSEVKSNQLSTTETLSESDRKRFKQLEKSIRSGAVSSAMKLSNALQSVEGFPNFIVGENSKQTLLHVAACGDAFSTSDGKVVLQKLSTPQTLEARDCNGDTPLLVATRKNRCSMVQVLHRIGADPDVVDTNGVGCLGIASSSQTFANKSGNTAFSLLVTENSIRYKNQQKQTPLMVAIHEGHPELVRIITRPSKHSTVIDDPEPHYDIIFSKKERIGEWAALLMEWGVSVELVTKKMGQTAYEKAIKRVGNLNTRSKTSVYDVATCLQKCSGLSGRRSQSIRRCSWETAIQSVPPQPLMTTADQMSELSLYRLGD